jgi:hypothetical protein
MACIRCFKLLGTCRQHSLPLVLCHPQEALLHLPWPEEIMEQVCVWVWVWFGVG